MLKILEGKTIVRVSTTVGDGNIDQPEFIRLDFSDGKYVVFQAVTWDYAESLGIFTQIFNKSGNPE